MRAEAFQTRLLDYQDKVYSLKAERDRLSEKLTSALALLNDRERIGQIMHDSWCVTKRAQGFHGPGEACSEAKRTGRKDCVKGDVVKGIASYRCGAFHADLIPWSDLPERQKDINRHAFDALGAEVRKILEANS